MLITAITFEVRTLFRERIGVVALAAFLAIGALTLAIGLSHTAQWNSAIESATDAQMEQVAEARGYFLRGESGPSERPWIDLSLPRWQDSYAGTRALREPSPLAPIAAGAVDPSPVAVQVSRSSDPLSASGHRIENPEIASRSIDLVVVIALLLPLLIGVLGLDIGSREREIRLDRPLIAQAGSMGKWLIYRVLAIVAVSTAAASLLCLLASILGGASIGEAATLLVFVVIYALLWGGILLAINSRARSVRAAAFGYGAVWMALCVLLPSIASEFATGRVQADFGVTETLEAREARYNAFEQNMSDVLPTLYSEHPHLRDLPAAQEDPLPASVRRHAFDVLLADALLDRHQTRLSQEQASRAIAEGSSWLSPGVAFVLGLERLSGVGPEAASEFRSSVVESVRERALWAAERAWSMQPLTSDDFEALVASSPPVFRASPAGVLGPALAILMWAGVSWAFALVGVSRAERRVVET